jgi:hypothetical protein
VKVYLAAAGACGSVESRADGPGFPELADLAESMAETLRRCPDCPDVPARRFLLALAECAPGDLAAGLRELAAEWL